MARVRYMADSNWGELDSFVGRHIGPSPVDQQRMLSAVGFQGWSSFLAAAVPDSVLLEESDATAGLPDGCSEGQALVDLRRIAALNAPLRSLIGLGYHGTITPAAIQRHVLENPCWYTSYTPYQAEIAQGRLEALLNFQTLISELTGLPIANASLLDEATAAAEAMALSLAAAGGKETRCFLVDDQVLPQTLEVLRTRAEPLGVIVRTTSARQLAEANVSASCLADVFGLMLQLPGREGLLLDPRPVIERLHIVGALVTVAIDPLTQVLLQPVGELGADIAIGSSQRLGVPMGFGGPHAAFFATGEVHKRRIPGRLVGCSRDRAGQPALRLALQTREQHIRRDRATSNICTAQVLLAVMAGFYAVHHGPEGLEAIARRILQLRERLRLGLVQLGLSPSNEPGFDTVSLSSGQAHELLAAAQAAGFNLRPLPLGALPQQARGLAISLDECSDLGELTALLNAFATALGHPPVGEEHLAGAGAGLDEQHLWPRLPVRQGPWLSQSVFHSHRNESDFVRYIHRLAARDFSLVQGMIPLGSCTMKLNAAAELVPVSWPEFSQLHPFAPADQSRGYARLTADLERWLAALTGFHAVSLQPNAGSQGEYAGLLVICAWHRQRGEGHRRVCLIPSSAHGTNPASAVMAGMHVVAVACDGEGNVDLEDLEQKARLHANDLAAAMVTYPSTHGVFEPGIRQLCDLIHRHGGQVYLDGANLNAQVGLAQPGSYGADVCHLNLHKTFCIPHGGGGPGVGPIAVAKHLAPFLPGHELAPSCGGEEAIGAVSAAPWGSAGILPISWMYIRMMGGRGLRQASAVALLSANYVASRLADHYPVLFRGPSGLVAHECILDLRVLRKSAGLEVDDLAKRLMDYGFHAPTVSWPVAGTVMVEPTESEPLPELDRFCEAMTRIRAEAAAIERGESDPERNPLRQSPHTLAAVTADEWGQPYSRAEAAYPMEGLRKNKHWPSVARIDNAYGDRHLICTCPSVEQLVEMGGQREPAPALAG